MRWATSLTILALLVLPGGAVLAQGTDEVSTAIGGPYELSWYTVCGGGEILARGGSYTLSGTVGQPDAGVQTGGGYSLGGGFWGGGALSGDFYPLYLPQVMR